MQPLFQRKSLASNRLVCILFAVSAPKQRILETAATLFFERGYELVGVNELIEKSGVAKSTFYQHFPSKEKLCVEWLRQEALESDASARELLQSPLKPIEKVAKKFDGLKDFLAESSFRGCPFSNTASVMVNDNEARTVVRQYKDNARFFWQALALQIQPDPTKAKSLGDALFLLISGAVTEAQNAKALWPVESAKEAALALCNADK
jgi:AcrR family transcriptional regulator